MTGFFGGRFSGKIFLNSVIEISVIAAVTPWALTVTKGLSDLNAEWTCEIVREQIANKV